MKKIITVLFFLSAVALTQAKTTPYISVHGGVNQILETDWQDTDPNSGSIEFDVAGTFDVAVGTSIADIPIRVELEYTWRKNDFDVIHTDGNPDQNGSRYDFTAHTLMGNVYYDFSFVKGPVVPYIFVGLGATKVQLNTPDEDLDDTVFAGQTGVGAAWSITDHILIDFKYRIMATADTEYNYPGGILSVDGLIYTELLAGIKFQF